MISFVSRSGINDRATALVPTLFIVLIVSACNSTILHAQQQDAEFADDAAIDKITVTARRTDELLSNIPVSATAVGAESAKPGARQTLSQAIELAPNTLFSLQGGPIQIRGVGSLGPDGGLNRQQGVALYFDDVFVSRSQGIPTFLEDIQRVEIVRGSQALLYGRNALGGVVNLVPTLPQSDLSGGASVAFGSDDFRRVRAAVNAPLSKHVRSRLFVQGNWNGGFITNQFDNNQLGGNDVYSLFAQVEADIGQATTVRFAIDNSRDEGDGQLIFAPVELANERQANFNTGQFLHRDILGFSARIVHDYDSFSLTAISAYRTFDQDQILDGDFGNFGPDFDFIQGESAEQSQFTQEIRLQSTSDGAFNWRAGAFYLHEDFDARQVFDLAAVPIELLSRNTFEEQSDSVSIFAELSFSVTEKLLLSGGLRYSNDTRSATSEISTPSGTFFFGAPAIASTDSSDDNIAPEFSASYQTHDNALLFARVSRGFKAGGVSQFFNSDGSANTFEPEKAWTYELGAKFSFVDGAVNLSSSLFSVDLENQQIVQFISPVARIITNAGESSSQGFELELSGTLTDGLTISAGYGYLDSQFDEFADAVTGNDFSGNRTPFSSRHSFSSSIQYSQAINSAYQLSSNVDFTYRSAFAFNAANLFEQRGFSVLNAAIGISHIRNRIGIRVFGENLTDENVLLGFFSFFGTDHGAPNRGRVIGLEVDMQF